MIFGRRDRATPASKDSPPGPSGEGDMQPVSSNVEAASRAEVERQDESRSESKTDTNSTSVGVPAATLGGAVRVSDTGRPTNAQRIQRLKAKVQELKAQLAEQKQNNEEMQAQVHEARAQAARKEKELQAQLVREQQLRAEEGAKLRKANVLAQGKQQEIKDLQAAHDRLQAIVEDRNAARLLAGGINIQAACPTLPEIEAHIRRALTVTVSEWVEDATPTLSSTVWVPVVLSRVFSECRELVGGIVQKNTSFMAGGGGREGEANMVDEATSDLFRQHIRRHHRTLFPLTGEHLQRACAEVISKLGYSVSSGFPDTAPSRVGEELLKTKLNRVVAEYLPILVGAALQHPAAAFSDDCGTVRLFDSTIHAESIDGAAVQTGQVCVVVFPSLLLEREGGHGFQPLSKPYVLPC